MNHPRGLFYLAFTEAWERFSFYGMSALLVLYMVNQLLLPGHVENVAGFTAFRATVESVFGPLSTQALASLIFGMYAGFVYFTPLLGGIIADRWIGQRNAVVIGALFMSGGHIAMAFDWSFLLALLLLVVGSGFIKGNISAQVGALYPRDDEARRTRGFAIFSMGINFGAVFGPLVCGVLAQAYGWHYGFGVAAIFMLAGLATYLVRLRHLPASGWSVAPVTRAELTPRTGAWSPHWSRSWPSRSSSPSATTSSRTCCRSGYRSTSPSKSAAHGIPIPWYQSIDPLFSILGVPLLFWIWQLPGFARRGEPDDLGKIGIGAWLCAAGNLVLVAAIARIAGRAGAPVLAFPALCHTGHRIPVLLADVARPRFARGAGEAERHDDGRRVHEPVRVEQPDRLGRRLLRENASDRVLGHARGDRGDGWSAGDGFRARLDAGARDGRR